jgi:hypothetical protein
MQQVEEQNKEAKLPKKGFTTKESPYVPMVPGENKGTGTKRK